jgi:hypothetical protein
VRHAAPGEVVPDEKYLPLFDRLLDLLDAIPGELCSRTAGPFFYAGLATRYEDERLTEDDRDRLPERINVLRPKRFDTWLSEREWIRRGLHRK